MNLKDIIAQSVPGISIDCVVFGYKERALHILALQYDDKAWALPGGFLPKNAEMDTVATEILEARTGVSNIFLEQFYTFSSLDRSWDCNELSASGFEAAKSNWPKEDQPMLARWFEQRFISTAYFALVDCRKVRPIPDAISKNCTWVSIKKLPDFILDHKLIITKALSHLRKQINYLPIGRELLEDKFTMLDLQVLYETILDKKLDRGNFQRKIMKLNMLIRHEKLMTGAQNKAPYLYSIDHDVYDQLIKNGIGYM